MKPIRQILGAQGTLITSIMALSLGGCATSRTTLPSPDELDHAGIVAAIETPRPASQPSDNGETLSVETDGTAVFQRSFWRRLGPDTRVPHAERREWKNATNDVTRWAWFIAVDASPAFRSWLLDESTFGLTPTVLDAALPAESAPSWFPVTAARHLTAYTTRGGRFVVLVDADHGRIFATDSGFGFAPPVAQRTAQNARPTSPN